MMICTATFSYAWRVAAEASQLNRGLREFQALGLRKDVIPILIPVYSRPHYLQRVIESLSRARGINDVSAALRAARLRRSRQLYLTRYIRFMHCADRASVLSGWEK